MNKKILWGMGVVIAALLLILAFGKSKDVNSSVMKIGIINPASGEVANLGEGVANAINLATSTTVSLRFEDDQCDPKKAIAAYTKLTAEDVHVFYVTCSGSVLALAPLAKQDGNLIVTAFAGSSEIRKTGDEVIRFIPDALSVAEAMAHYASNVATTSKMGLLYEEQDYAKSAAMLLQDKLGQKILTTEQYSSADTTFRTQIAKLKAAGINTLLYIPTSDKAAQLVYKEMQTLGYKPAIIGDVNVCEYQSPKDFGLSAVCFDAGFTNETAGYKQFVSDYAARYGKPSNAPFYHSISYDIIKIIDDFGKTHGQDIAGLKKYILGGVQGHISSYAFTPNGEVVSAEYLKQFEK